MKFEDDSQNLRARLRVIQILAILMITALGVRLYYLQIIRGAYYAERAENQRIRLLPIPAPRGVILDRNNKLLVDSRPIYNVILSREDINGKDFTNLVKPYAKGLNVDAEELNARFLQLKSQPAFESFMVKENVTPADIAWVDAHSLEFPELRVELQPQRRYPEDGKLAHVLGYVGEISQEQLDLPQYKEKGYKPGDIIGKEGLEKVYDDYLRGRDGYRKVIVDSRGHIQDEVERVEPQPGQDLVTTIDSDLQNAAEEQLRNSVTKRGVIVAMDPNNGEILALASYPTYDPNLFSQRIASKEGRAEYAALTADPKTPLINRAIQGRYPPGSTWKIPMSVAGLQQGAISVDHSNLVCGGGITVGNKFTRCMGNHGVPELRYAITKSCDGYFYRLGLKMGVDGIIKMVDEFDLNRRTGVDLPHELVSWTPAYWKPELEKRHEEWKDIRTVYASVGQDTVVVTPLASLRAVSAIAVGGRMYVPHFFKEARAIGAPDTPDYRPARTFDRPDPKIIDIPEDQHHIVVEGMWGVVNNGGTAHAIKSSGKIQMVGFDIAGKTGTAQVVSLGKDTGNNKDHAWFVSFAPAYQPEIAVIALIENVGFGGTHAAPAVRAIYEAYYRKTRHVEPPGSQMAQKQQRQTGATPPASTAALTAHR
ncbi:MAG: penicillin-binding protein 2 [Acidobacteriota bacterium]|jgi:penicillin-binding protein 2|nr:penicillin-binding protein 2 [Acidobacteriota bacterium]